MKGAISSLNRILEEAIEIRTLNTQVQRISENQENLIMIEKYSDDCKLMTAIDDSISKYNMEMIENLNKMKACLVSLQKMIDLGLEEIDEYKKDISIDNEYLN